MTTQTQISVYNEWREAQQAQSRHELDLAALCEAHGSNATGPWVVVRTKFHGGGIVSRHRTATLALDAARRHRITDCDCGCCVVMPATAAADLPSDSDSPYAPTI
jgi:hypothetical protein